MPPNNSIGPSGPGRPGGFQDPYAAPSRDYEWYFQSRGQDRSTLSLEAQWALENEIPKASGATGAVGTDGRTSRLYDVRERIQADLLKAQQQENYDRVDLLQRRLDQVNDEIAQQENPQRQGASGGFMDSFRSFFGGLFG